MTTYFNPQRLPREKLPSPSSSILPSPSPSPPPGPSPSSSILIFPAPSSAPPSPASATVASAGRNSLSAFSIPTSFISSLANRSRSQSREGSGWEDVGAMSTGASSSHPRGRTSRRSRMRVDENGSPYFGPEPLTMDRVERFGSGYGGSWALECEDPLVEVWDWSRGETPEPSSSGFSISISSPRRRGPVTQSESDMDVISTSGETHYEDASSQFEPEDDTMGITTRLAMSHRSESEFSLFLVPNPSASSDSTMSQPTAMITKSFHLPFEAILRFLFNLDGSTLDLLKRSIRTRPRPRPGGRDTEIESSLFAASPLRETDPEYGEDYGTEIEDAESKKHNPHNLITLHSCDSRLSIGSLRKGLEVAARLPYNSLVFGINAPLYAWNLVPSFSRKN